MNGRTRESELSRKLVRAYSDKQRAQRNLSQSRNYFKNISYNSNSQCFRWEIFSALKKIKNYLCTTLSEDHLNDLAILHIESDFFKNISYDKLIRHICCSKSQKKMYLSFVPQTVNIKKKLQIFTILFYL